LPLPEGGGFRKAMPDFAERQAGTSLKKKGLNHKGTSKALLMKFNQDKFKRLVQYICCKAPPKKFGSVKLNKILWYSENFWFKKFGESITGASFIKKNNGPVAANLTPTLDILQQEGSAKVIKGREFEPTTYKCKRLPDMSDFNENFLNVVDITTDIICNTHTSKTIIKLSHDKLWTDAEDGEILPIAACCRDKNITDEECLWGKTCQG
jgi:hypothetical protein